MKISDFLAPDDALIDLHAPDKMRVLQILAGRAAAALDLSPEVILSELQKRENLGSTGMGNGVAIPHTRLDGVKRPFGLLARLESAIEFGAIDGQKVDVVFLLLLPTTAQGEQLTALASVARRLRDPEALACVRRAADSAGLYQAVSLG